MFLEKNFTGCVIKYSDMISFEDGSISECFPDIRGYEVFFEQEPNLYIKGTVIEQKYSNHSCIIIRLEDTGEITVLSNDYDKIYLVI